MGVQIEDTGRPCPECGQPLKFYILSKFLGDPHPVTITGCQACGIANPAEHEQAAQQQQPIT